MVSGIGEIKRDLPIKHGKDEGIGSIPIEGANHHISIIPIVQKYYSEQIGIVPMVWYDIGKEQYPDE